MRGIPVAWACFVGVVDCPHETQGPVPSRRGDSGDNHLFFLVLAVELGVGSTICDAMLCIPGFV